MGGPLWKAQRKKVLPSRKEENKLENAKTVYERERAVEVEVNLKESLARQRREDGSQTTSGRKEAVLGVETEEEKRQRNSAEE